MKLALKILRTTRGASVLFIIVIFSISIFIGQQFVLMNFFTNLKAMRYNQIREARISLLGSLEELITNEAGLKNSRFAVNTNLIQCLTAQPAPCDESVLYDMVLFTPNPPVSYMGFPWPDAPAGIDRLAGGLNANKIIYNSAGGRCDVLGEFEMSERCPLQAIIRFRPLCGGTVAIPTLSGLPCTGPVTGIEIIAGVAILMNGQFVYHQKTDQDRDSILMRVSSNLFNY